MLEAEQERTKFERNYHAKPRQAGGKVKFDETPKHRSKLGEYGGPKPRLTKATYQVEDQKPKYENVYRPGQVPGIMFNYLNYDYHESSTEPESDIESLYDNDNFTEEESECTMESDYNPKINQRSSLRASIEDLQFGLKKITNKYVQEVQSQVDTAMSKLKIQEKAIPKLVKKVDEHGAGDVKRTKPQTGDILKKMEEVKQNCYRKIGANLKMLEKIDSITNEVFLDHLTVYNKK